MTCLLDANLLFPLGWSHHLHHRAALAWFRSRGQEPWATCLITQSAFLRLSMNPLAMNTQVSSVDALAELSSLVSHPQHLFLAQDAPLNAGAFVGISQHLTGYRQVTDATLLHVAHANGASFATFDTGVAQLAPSGLHVELLQP